MDANRQEHPRNEAHHELEDFGDRASDAQNVDPVSGGFDPQAPADLHAPVRRPTVYNLRVIR